MKKIFALALALVLGLTALSSLALVDTGSASTQRIQFESIQISTNYAVVPGAVGGVSSIADAGAIYSEFKAIYGVLKFNINGARTGKEALTVQIKSDNVIFPDYLSYLTFATHYVDAYGVLQVATTGISPSVSNNVVKIIVDTSDTGLYAGIPFAGKDSNGNFVTDAYVGFQGIVKAPGTATEGKIIGYMTVSGSSFTTAAGEAYVGTTVDANGRAPFVDIYEGGNFKYRVYELIDTNGAREYLVQPGTSKDAFSSYGVGFKNNDANTRFSKITLRKGLAYNGYSDTLTTNAIIAADSAILSGTTYLDADTLASIESYYKPIMDFFGFSFAYTTALQQSHFTGKAGYNDEKVATFKYLDTTIIDDDDDIVVPPTGDASASVLIVLGASALLAAAALFFVMKKARD